MTDSTLPAIRGGHQELTGNQLDKPCLQGSQSKLYIFTPQNTTRPIKIGYIRPVSFSYFHLFSILKIFKRHDIS